MKPALCPVLIVTALALCACTGAPKQAATPAPAQPPAAAQASAPGAVAQPPKDPQAGYEPRSAPGEGQKLLTRFEGDWEVVKTFYPRSGEPAVSRGTCRQRMIEGGRFLESDFVFHDQNGDTTGKGIVGFDERTGKFTSFWIDSRSTRFSVRQSEEPFDGEHVVLISESVGEPGAQARRSHTIAALEQGGRRLVHRQYTAGPDGKDRLVMQLELTRK